MVQKSCITLSTETIRHTGSIAQGHEGCLASTVGKVLCRAHRTLHGGPLILVLVIIILIMIIVTIQSLWDSFGGAL